MYGNGISAYQQTDVLTANPKKLVIMCYEGAISNLKIAKERHLSGEYEAKAKALQKAQDIMVELTVGLDFEKGGQIAKNLDALYRYILRRITEGDLKRDVTSIDEVAGMLEELKGAWEEIFYGRKEDAEFASHLSDESSAQGAMAYGR
jgi:flagellar protein FliS